MERNKSETMFQMDYIKGNAIIFLYAFSGLSFLYLMIPLAVSPTYDEFGLQMIRFVPKVDASYTVTTKDCRWGSPYSNRMFTAKVKNRYTVNKKKKIMKMPTNTDMSLMTTKDNNNIINEGMKEGNKGSRDTITDTFIIGSSGLMNEEDEKEINGDEKETRYWYTYYHYNMCISPFADLTDEECKEKAFQHFDAVLERHTPFLFYYCTGDFDDDDIEKIYRPKHNCLNYRWAMFDGKLIFSWTFFRIVHVFLLVLVYINFTYWHKKLYP